MGVHSRTLATSILVAGKMSALVASMAMAAALSRLLVRSDYGAFTQVITLYAVLSVVFQVGIPQSLYYFLPRLDSGKQKGFALQGAGLLMLQGAVIAIALYMGAQHIGRAWNSPKLPELLRTFAPYPIFMLPVVAMENVLAISGRTTTVALFNALSKSCAFIAVVAPIWMGWGMQSAIQCWVGFAAIQFVVAMITMLWPFRNVTAHFELRSLKAQYAYALPFGIAAIFGALAYYADKIIVNLLHGPEVYAVYVNGAIELPIVGVVGVAVTMAITPSMVEYAKSRHTDELLQLWHRAQQKVAVVLFAFLGWMLFFAHETVTLLFSRQYSEATILFQIFLFLIPARLCSFQSIMVPLRLNWAYTLGHIIQVVCAFSLSVYLITAFGLPGAAFAVVVSLYVNVWILAKFTSHSLGIPVFSVWPCRCLAINLLLAIGCGGIARLMLLGIPQAGYLSLAIRLGLGGLVFGALYAILGSRLGIVQWSELRALVRTRTAMTDDTAETVATSAQHR